MRRPIVPRRPSPEMTVAEVADVLGLSEATVRRRIDAGLIPGTRTGAKGGAFAINRAAFAAWMKGERAPSIAVPLPEGLLAPGLIGAEFTLQVTVRVTGMRMADQKSQS